MKSLKEFMSLLTNNIKFKLEKLLVYFYRCTIKYKIRMLENKPRIKVLFLISSLPKWKTEELYKEMLKTPHLEPLLGIALIDSDDRTDNNEKNRILIEYLNAKKYSYKLLNERTNLKQDIKPDIIIYQEPYYGVLPKNLFYTRNLYALFCYAHYGYYSIDLDFSYNCALHWVCWQVYYENDITLNAAKLKSKIQACNGLITGLPMTDVLLLPRECFPDPWNKIGKDYKRIIWAPHHSIPTISNYIHYSIFLDIADEMIDIAMQFRDQIQIAFKPHPDLKNKLVKVWGKERTEAYYHKWNEMYNTQVEQGDYIGLFKYSDAMIHDCASFTIEYLYMNKPVMYLENGLPHADELTDFGKQAYDLHYKGRNVDHIRQFIKDILNGDDKMFDSRLEFRNKKLLPPNNKTASENIINEILKNFIK